MGLLAVWGIWGVNFDLGVCRCVMKQNFLSLKELLSPQRCGGAPKEQVLIWLSCLRGLKYRIKVYLYFISILLQPTIVESKMK